MKGTKPKYRRILLKLSGEALGDDKGNGIAPERVADMAEQIGEVRRMEIEVVIVIGGGNIFRGVAGSEKGIERATADYMGMLATVINSLALQDALVSSIAILCSARGRNTAREGACAPPTHFDASALG